MKPRIPVTTEAATARLEALCARSEHCSFEIYEKLQRMGITGAEAQNIVNNLTGARYIDDLRYARFFVRDRYRFSGHGRIKIRIALSAKRIPRNFIDEAMEEIDPEIYAETLRRVLMSKIACTDISTFEGRTKVFRFGMSRGYESDLVSSTLKEILRTL